MSELGSASDVFVTPPQRPPPGPLKRKAPEEATPAKQRPRREHGERHHRAFEAGPYTPTIFPSFQVNYDFSSFGINSGSQVVSGTKELKLR